MVDIAFIIFVVSLDLRTDSVCRRCSEYVETQHCVGLREGYDGCFPQIMIWVKTGSMQLFFVVANSTTMGTTATPASLTRLGTGGTSREVGQGLDQPWFINLGASMSAVDCCDSVLTPWQSSHHQYGLSHRAAVNSASRGLQSVYGSSAVSRSVPFQSFSIFHQL